VTIATRWRGATSAAAAVTAALALRDTGVTPPGVDPAHHRVRSVSAVLPPEDAFKEACREELTARPGVAQASV